MQLCYTVMAVVLASGLAAAQDVSTKSKTTVKVEDGKTITVTGCIDRAPEGGYMLTNVSNMPRTAFSVAPTTGCSDPDWAIL